MKVIVKILTDCDIENPSEFMDCTWKIHSFNRHHASFSHPENFENIGIRRKLAVGTAFMLSYYEHGACQWSLRGTGPSCRFDSVDYAGIMTFDNPKDMGAKTYEDRRQDAKIFLDLYTDWCNGYGHGYVIETEDGEELDSCFGFYDSQIEHTINEIVSQLEYLEKEHGALEVELEDDNIWAPNINKIRNFGKVLT